MGKWIGSGQYQVDKCDITRYTMMLYGKFVWNICNIHCNTCLQIMVYMNKLVQLIY